VARQNLFTDQTQQQSTLDQSYDAPFNRVPRNILARGLKPYGYSVPGLQKLHPDDDKIRRMAIAAVIAKYRKAHAGR